MCVVRSQYRTEYTQLQFQSCKTQSKNSTHSWWQQSTFVSAYAYQQVHVIHVCTHINNNMVHYAIALFYCCEVFLLCLNVTNAIKEMAYIITQHSNLTQDWLTNEPQPIRVIAFTIKSTLHSCHASELLCSCKTAYKPSKLSATNMKPHTSTSYQLPDHTQTHVMNPQLWMLPQPRLLLKS